MGLLSDRLGRRKPVLIGGACVLLSCLAWILYGRPGMFPPYLVGLVTGVASGSAMLTYTIIKEANPPHLNGTSTGAISFMNFTTSALFGPVSSSIMAGASAGQEPGLEHYQITFRPLLFGVALAIVLTAVLKETGPAVREPVAVVDAL